MSRLLLRFTRLTITLLLVQLTVRAQPFRVDTVARAPYAQYPVSLSFSPDGSGKLFFTEKKTGRLRAYDGSLRPEPLLSLKVESEGEQGLLGVTLHPQYPDTPYVYVFYTRSIDRSNVVERYRDSAGVGVAPRSIMLVPRMEDENIHSGGDIQFGPDGKLYISVGDYGNQPERAQDITTKRNYWGKILRFNDDGTIPEDNPNPGSPIWAYGLRNPMGLTFDRLTGDLYCTDNGESGRNEINRVEKGANLGWPDEEMDAEHRIYVVTGNDLPGLTAVMVYRGNAFPKLRGKFLFGGYAARTVWVGSLTPEEDSLTVQELFTTNAGFADIKEAPDGTIFLVNGPYVSSRILRLAPVRPLFVSSPPSVAIQESLYTYTPECSGTPPAISIVSGPDGMTLDTTAGAISWQPTNLQALAGSHPVILRAENGAGYADQMFTIDVQNINDPPMPFGLHHPPNGAELYVTPSGGATTFKWELTQDPDADSLVYIFELDTTYAFQNSLVRETLSAETDTLRVVIPISGGSLFWRVLATDGEFMVRSTPPYRVLSVNLLVPAFVEEMPQQEQEEVILGQNFPNPFNPATSIQYTVPRAGHVRLAVFNLLGQEVAVIQNGIQSEGTHTVAFDKENLPSGIYFYRLQGPGFFETKKMIVAK